MLGNFSCCLLLTFLKITFLKTFFQEQYQSLQARVSPYKPSIHFRNTDRQCRPRSDTYIGLDVRKPDCCMQTTKDRPADEHLCFSLMTPFATCDILIILLVCVAKQTGVSLTLSEMLKIGFLTSRQPLIAIHLRMAIVIDLVCNLYGSTG